MEDNDIKDKVLALIPQAEPFRFIDEILEIDESRVVSAYRFKAGEWFYKGHFPGNPVTPGVVLLETMAQAGLTALAVFHYLNLGLAEDDIRKKTMVFALADTVEFGQIVKPGDRVIVTAEKEYFRKGNLKTRVVMTREDGVPVCRGVLTGKGVNHEN
jgi:3-hydroxyacyl-[acyl-carrier-protein] dehydratase